VLLEERDEEELVEELLFVEDLADGRFCIWYGELMKS